MNEQKEKEYQEEIEELQKELDNIKDDLDSVRIELINEESYHGDTNNELQEAQETINETSEFIEMLPFSDISKITLPDQAKLKAFCENYERFTEAQFEMLMELDPKSLELLVEAKRVLS